MLKQRILTALILIPLFIVLILSLNSQQFCVLTGVLVFWCGWEWSTLMGLTSRVSKIVYPFMLTLILATLLLLLSNHWVSVPQLLYPALGWWLLAAVLVKSYPGLSSFWGKGLFVRGLMGVMVLVPCWVALNFIHGIAQGPYVLLFLFVIIWGADTGAYFAGKKWGKTKLLPEVSPGKTWQGVCGGLLTSMLVAMVGIVLFDLAQSYWIPTMLLAMVTVVFSVLGDLFESMLKRQVGVKDSGKLLPGHGGILDRIDSLTAAAPIFALGLLVVGAHS